MTTIASEIASIIDAMSVVGGYNFNWSNLNEPDSASKTTWPSAIIRYNNEKPAYDTIPAIYGFHNCEVVIEVEYKITPSTTVKPEFTADAGLDMCLTDLRKAFGRGSTGYLPISGSTVLTFISSEKIRNTRADTYKPVKLVTTWNCFYQNL